MSYISLRFVADGTAVRYLEQVAHALFMLGLFALAVITLLFAYEVV